MGEVVATIKGDGAAPWIVVHGETAAECEQALTEALGGLIQTATEAGQLLAATVNLSKGAGAAQGGQGGQPPNNQFQQQPQQNQWQQNGTGGNQYNQPADNFVGSPNPEGKTCQLCGSLLIGKRPKVKRMWSCPNQRAQGDGHTVEWING